MKGKIGILGGTFNPIHYGHLRPAEEVREKLGLEKVIFIPTYIQPLKNSGENLETGRRLEMAKLAVQDNPFFEVDDCEIRRGGDSYTVDTLEHFRETHPGAQLHFIAGSDSWKTITHWKSYEKLFELAWMVIMNRKDDLPPNPDRVLPVEVADRLCYDDGKYAHPSGGGVLFVSVTGLDISASDIRARCGRGESIRYLLPPRIHDYIQKEKLYTGESKEAE